MKMVMAHELGHAIMHRKENCYFIRNRTFLSTAHIETEANTFAAELLIPDSIIFDNPGTQKPNSKIGRVQRKLMEFKKL